ncbi:hypothetical protein E4T39_01172, partial [Aureobasidium subglaciale]
HLLSSSSTSSHHHPPPLIIIHLLSSSPIHHRLIRHLLTVTKILGVATAVSGVAGSAHQPPTQDVVLVSAGLGNHCNESMFGYEVPLFQDRCVAMPPFNILRSRTIYADHAPDDPSNLGVVRCVLGGFTDRFCDPYNGFIIEELVGQDQQEPVEMVAAICKLEIPPGGTPLRSLMWTCSDTPPLDNVPRIYPTKPDVPDTDNDTTTIIVARSTSGSSEAFDFVNAGRLRDHVTLAPADSTDCNSAQHRDTDTKIHGHCHSFKKPFFSASATISRGQHPRINKGDDCSVLVFSDNKCKNNGVELIDLNDQAALGVCHNAYLYGDLPAHSWMWLCKREIINSHLGSGSGTLSSSEDSSSEDISTSINSMECSTTTQYGTTTRVFTDLITNTHVSTAVVTKTTTNIKTNTDVVTHHHTKVVPFSSTFKVCNVEVHHSEL